MRKSTYQGSTPCHSVSQIEGWRAQDAKSWLVLSRPLIHGVNAADRPEPVEDLVLALQ